MFAMARQARTISTAVLIANAETALDAAPPSYVRLDTTPASGIVLPTHAGHLGWNRMLTYSIERGFFSATAQHYLRFVTAVLLGSLLCAATANSASPDDSAGDWRAYFGNQSRAAPWAGLVRGIGLGATGLGQLDSDQRSNSRPKVDINSLSEKVSELTLTHDVLLPSGGLESARRQEIVDRYMNMIEADAGKEWRRLIREQIITVERAAKVPGRIYWQVGNEINSRHYDLSLRTWKNDKGASTAVQSRPQQRERPAKRRHAAPGANEDGGDEDGDRAGERERRLGGNTNAESIIPLYVEYLLAPTVEAIDAASRELYGAPGRIPILLGSLANARSPAAHQWLDKLLNYKIDGRYAPALAGKHVYELVDILAIHYVVSYPGDEWRETLDSLRNQWVGKGRVRGIWSTEELGRRRALRGLGAATTLRVAFRYLDWAIATHTSPESARVNFWGADMGETGTSGNDGMQVLYNWLGKGAVTRITAGQTKGDTLERYGFMSVDNRRRAYLLFSNRESTNVKLDRIALPESAATEQQVHVFTAEGHRVITARKQAAKNGTQELILDIPLTLQADQTLLVLQGNK